jgi:hypothetical protein
MKRRLVFISLLLLPLFLTLAPTALASSTWYVDGVHGKNKNDCKSRQTACKTIGHAISLAHSGDSIMVAAASYKENLTIGFSLKIIGSSAKTTIIDGGGVGTVVTIPHTSSHVTLSKVTIRKGSASSGGGINNSGTLTIDQSTVSGNRAVVKGCSSQCAAYGGGISNGGNLAVSNSTVSGNRAVVKGCSSNCTAYGGGISNGGNLAVSNSTVSGNSAVVKRCTAICGEAGGGIRNLGNLAVNNSTVGGNTLRSEGCSHFCSGSGAGLFFDRGGTISNSTIALNGGDGIGSINGGSPTLQNTIVAYNRYNNCNSGINSLGYNLSSDNSCSFNGPGDLKNTDPKLGQLGNYGGPTQTIPLLSRSPAIDAGNPGGCTDGKGHLLKTDQRGKPRPDKEDSGGCDMGAYERQKD